MTLALPVRTSARPGRRTTTTIGLDLGSTAVRAFEVTHRPSGPVVEHVGSAPVSPGAVRGGLVEDPRAVTAALKQLWSQQRFRSRHVVLGLTHPQVVVRELVVPPLGDKDRALALPYLVRDIVPYPADQALLDFHPIGPVAGGSGEIEGLVVAAPKDVVVRAVAAVHKAGLTVDTVDLASFAVMRATATAAAGAEVVVDIGAYVSTIVVHQAGIPRMVRCVPRGGAEITALVALRHDLSLDAAEAQKCEVGLGPHAADLVGPDDDDGIAATVGEALRPLFREIRSSVTFHDSHHPDEPVARVSLCGGGSLLPGLVETVRRRLEVPTRIADPLARLLPTHRGGDRGRPDLGPLTAASAAVAVGLTLGGVS